jgi:tetratricopeptide (TPR) repeat protein
MNSIALVVTTLALATFAPGASASERIKLKSGAVVSGRATAYDATKEVLSFRTDAGEDVTYTLSQLDARSVYLVYASVIPKDDAKGQLQLANFARDAGIYEHAARRYGYAEQADPSLKATVERERAELRRKAAETCLALAKEALAKKDTKSADKYLTLLLERLPGEPQAAEAARLLDGYYAAEASARDDAAERELAEHLQKDLKKGKELYDRMLQRTQEGLTARSESKSKGLWEGALADGQGVLKEIDKLAAKYGSDPKVQEGAARYRKITRDHMVDVHLHLASQRTVKSDYKDAEKHVNAALALDPRNGEALAARARIEAAASEGLFSWW